MRRAGSLLLLLLLLSLSACTAEGNNKESLGDAISLTGRKWKLGGRRAMASRGHGVARKDEAVGASNTGANQEAGHASAESVHDEGKRSKGLQGANRHHPNHHGGDAATMASDMLRMDYSVSVDVHSRRPINNDAPLDELVEKNP